MLASEIVSIILILAYTVLLLLYIHYIYIFFIIYSHTTNVKDKECFYIDILRDGSMLSKNDCPKINSATKCPIAWLDTCIKISPVKVSSCLYFYSNS